MKLDGKVKGGLAWAGLVIILAVPAADMIFGKSGDNTAATAVTSDAAGATGVKAPALKPAIKTDPIQTASADGNAAVDRFVKSGKKLPSYISDAEGEQPVASTPTVKAPAVKPPVAVTTPTAVASVPAETPPIPLPRSARPQATQVASLPADEEPPLIIDQNRVQQDQAATEPFPLSDEGADVVTSDQLEEWDSGSLADYLERKGLMTETSSQVSGEYDPDGFYLDEGPNKVKRPRQNLDFFLF